MKTKIYVAFVFCASLSAMLLAGCGGPTRYQFASSGLVGCAPKDVIVTDLDSNVLTNSRSWNAACNGTSYYCSGIYDNRSIRDATCTKK